jgi:hypothetical protein
VLQRETLAASSPAEAQASGTQAPSLQSGATMSASQRDAVRHLALQLRDLLATLDAQESDLRRNGK